MTRQADKVSHASLNGIYVKAQEMDRGHNKVPAPTFAPPGSFADATSHASDAQSHASARADASTHASDADASTHATGSGEPC